MAELREEADLTVREVAEITTLCTATITRIETGERRSRDTETAALLTAYRVDKTKRQEIMELVVELDQVAWFEPTSTGLRLRKSFTKFEELATGIVNFETAYVPGLLQTEAYARALMATAPTSAEWQKEALERRMKRKEILTKLGRPRFHAILDEAVLRRAFGGPAIMAHQIRELIKQIEEGHAVIQVIPFRLGGYHNLGSFKLMTFRRLPTIVYIEHSGVAGFLGNPKDVDPYRDAVSNLMNLALGSAESVKFLHSMASDHDRG